MRSLISVGVTIIPTSTEEHSTTGPITGPICKKASAISIGVNRPKAFSPMKLRASTTRNEPSGSTISRFEGFSPQIACEEATPSKEEGSARKVSVLATPRPTSTASTAATASPI